MRRAISGSRKNSAFSPEKACPIPLGLSVRLEEQVLREDGPRGRRLCDIQEPEWHSSTCPKNPANQAFDSVNDGSVLEALHGAELQRAEHLLYRGRGERLFMS